MEPNDTQPGGPSSRTITIHLTRDTLLLIAALVFLGVAILLAVIFPSASSSNPTPPSTDVAQAATAQPESRATLTPNVELSTPAANSISEPESNETNSESSYPAPTSNVPVFDPNRTAETTNGLLAQATDGPYPAPQGTTATAPTTAIPTTNRGTTPTRTPAVFQPAPTVAVSPEVPPTEAPAELAPTRPPAAPPTARPPTPIPSPTPVPVDVLRGNIRWTTARSPIRLTRDQQLAPGATLVIEPGVEVRLAPGVSFFVEGTLYAVGAPDRPVRFVGSDRQRWEGLFGRPGSNIALEHTEIRGGGAGGTLLTSEGGNLVLRHARINDNGGHIQVSDSHLEMRDSEIAGNDMPYGAALDASYLSGNSVILTNNRIGGNRQQAGSPPVSLSNQSAFETLNLDIQGNLLVGQDAPDLLLFTNGPLQGGLACNALIGGTNGLSLRSETPQVPGFALNVHDNATEKHTPPIIPIYLEYGIGRGATSEIALDMRNNWWGSPLGPYEPDRHADGRGEAVGDNIEFAPWLTERPACAPTQ
ncbi:MAG TPA: right-handed parallel beta-helix repeat-containing protein [Roseiflexaceae bacterium]|nr:right-handed parallel beta-helix repeat-containing protein [Roseiflexaceae bacterium]